MKVLKITGYVVIKDKNEDKFRDWLINYFYKNSLSNILNIKCVQNTNKIAYSKYKAGQLYIRRNHYYLVFSVSRNNVTFLKLTKPQLKYIEEQIASDSMYNIIKHLSDINYFITKCDNKRGGIVDSYEFLAKNVKDNSIELSDLALIDSSFKFVKEFDEEITAKIITRVKMITLNIKENNQ